MLSGLPTFPGLDKLSQDELRAIMPVKTGDSPAAQVENLLRRIYLYAIQTHSSDIHISGIGSHEDTLVKIGVRAPGGFENFTYEGTGGRYFLEKIFALTNTPQGGTTAPCVSTRFSIALPARFAEGIGLMPNGDAPYSIDVRVEYIRTVDGFKIVTRLLDQVSAPKYEQLGFSRALDAVVRRAVFKEAGGLILVTGPTGSGKSTSLNAVLNLLNDGTRAINTIEDPVEYTLRGQGPIGQIAVSPELTFARALRSILRQDPDVVLVGEIRDTETMLVALNAAQTGHIVFSTLHANSAAETITRAMELTGGERRHAFVLAEVLRLVLAQRLVPTYGGESRRRDLQVDEASWLAHNGMDFMKLIAEVDGRNVLGRVPLVEAIEVTPEVKKIIQSPDISADKIYRAACNQPQYETLAMAGVRAIESVGAKLQDCMVALETTQEAQAHPGLRLQTARSENVSLATVSEAIDRQLEGAQRGEVLSLEGCVRQAESTAWEAV